ncbi:MAG: leucine-rich repeat protein [Clostridia bacterium]|nr:leucine-rich repeat protein [Clostridia bacterium]
MSKKDKKKNKANDWQTDVHLEIPEDEIWTYQVPGLAAPHVNKPYKYYNLKKFIFVFVIIIAVSLSMYFSIKALQNDTFEYTETEQGIEFSKFSNTGYIYELDIDYVSSVEYIAGNNDPNTNFKVVKDTSKPINSVRQFTLNCDDKIKTIRIGADVNAVDTKAFYSCWALQNIEVDENNPNYCDVDGVLYNKDKTEILCYPCDHDEYLRQKYGYNRELYKDEVTPEYERDVQTYVVPSTVVKIDEMCFNYANLRVIYLPEGLKTIETLAVFKLHERVDEWGTTPSLTSIYSYKSDKVTDTHFTTQESLGEVYKSLPEGLEFIGSDAFSYNQALSYVYIPDSVTYIGHHAFWDTVYKEDGDLVGVTVMNVAVSEASLEKNVEIGDDWLPKYDYLLFKKAIDVKYSAERENV